MRAMGQADKPNKPDDFAAIIREALQSQGITQAQLAAASGVNRSTLRRWQTGEITDPTLSQLRAVAAALHLSGEELLRGMGWPSGAYINLREVPTTEMFDELQRRFTESYETGREVDGDR